MKPRSYAVPLTVPLTVPLVLSLAVLLAVPLPGLAAPRADAAQTCAGREATIVGTGEREIRATAGPDVILTEGARVVRAWGGADVVCVTGPAVPVTVHAGPGDDQVLAASTDVLAYLDDGTDTFVGGPGDDYVTAGDQGEAGEVDEHDVISTGAGDDVVVAGTYEVDVADEIDLGPGRDHVELSGRVLGEGARLVGGTGADELQLSYSAKYQEVADEDPDSALDWLVTNTPTGGTAVAGGVQKLAWTGFEHFVLSSVARSYDFVGSPADESVSGNPLRSASMGAGDDRVAGDDLRRVDGGPGRDSLDAGYCLGAVVADLRTRRYRCRGRTLPIPGVEDLAAAAASVDVHGSARAERISVQACRGAVHGLGGPDVLRVVDRGAYLVRFLDLCGRGGIRPVRLLGDAGDDVLRGSRARDLLQGGAGRDRADGRGGRDTCRAERRTACES